MGIIRLCLALVVLLGHAPAAGLLPIFYGPLAVEGFFILSGFYIQLILGRYARGPGWRRRFYASRMVRIFSLYWPVLIATVVYLCVIGDYPLKKIVEEGRASTLALAVLTNLLIVGQDAMGIFAYDAASGGIEPPDPWNQTPAHSLAGLAVVRQAWSLSPEILFYLIAPFVLRWRSVWVAALAGLSLAFKMGLERRLVDWTALCFPCELWLFLLGALACRGYGRWLENRPAMIAPAAVLGMALLAATVFYHAVQARLFPLYLPADIPQRYGYFLLLAGAAPFVFRVSRDSRIDRFLGELSYPVYLTHLLVIDWLNARHLAPGVTVWLAVLLTLGLSITVAKCVEMPITVLRHRWFRPRETASFNAKD